MTSATGSHVFVRPHWILYTSATAHFIACVLVAVRIGGLSGLVFAVASFLIWVLLLGLIRLARRLHNLANGARDGEKANTGVVLLIPYTDDLFEARASTSLNSATFSMGDSK